MKHPLSILVKFLWTYVFLLCIACETKQMGETNGPTGLFEAPILIAKNKASEEIKDSVYDSHGRLIQTGCWHPIEFKAMPKVKTAEELDVELMSRQQYPQNKLEVPLPNAQLLINLNSPSINRNQVDFILKDQKGRVIPTGKPLKLKGKTVDLKHPNSVVSSEFNVKDERTQFIQNLDIENGLPSSTVWQIMEDSQGFLWFGTEGGGLVKYDGLRMTTYNVHSGLNENIINDVIEDSKGGFWIATEGGGVSYFDGWTFTHYTRNEQFISNFIRVIYEDKDGNVWFGSVDGGVSCFNGNTFTHYTRREGLLSSAVYAINQDDNGVIWMGTKGAGICKLEDGVFTHYTKENGLCDDRVWALEIDQNNLIWVGTAGGGLSCFDGKSFLNLRKEDGLGSDIILSIYEDKHGAIWVGTHGAGLRRLSINGETIQIDALTTKEGMSSNYVVDVYENNYGAILAATKGGGINMYHPDEFVNITNEQGLKMDFILGLLQDTEGNIWYTSESDGIGFYDGEYLNTYWSRHKLSNIRSATLGKSGDLWFGGVGGLIQYTSGRFKHYGNDQGLTAEVVLSVFTDSKGTLWMGTFEEGLYQFKTDTFFRATDLEGLPSNMFLGMIEDHQGQIWGASSGMGACIFKKDAMMVLSTNEGLSCNLVTCFYEDSDHNMWIGTENGLNCYDGKSVKQFYAEQGLCSNVIWAIKEDHKGRVWVATEKGVNVLTLINGQLLNNIGFDKKDGLKGIGFFLNSLIIDKENNLWAGNEKGIARLNLSTFSVADTVPNVYLDHLSVNGEDLNLNGVKQFGEFSPFYGLPTNLELPHNKNHLTFHFSAIDWSAPHKIKFSYQIEGVDDGWSLPSNEAKADYRNLPYGKHFFKVAAIGENGKWGKPIVYVFEIVPPFWLSGWAILIYIIVSIVLIYFLFRWRVARLKAHEAYLKNAVKNATEAAEKQAKILKKTLISNEEKEVLLKEIHHRVKNNLQIINSLIRLQSDFMNESNFEEKLKETEDRIQSMRLIHEMLYKSNDLTALNVRDYIFELKDYISDSYILHHKIEFALEIEDFDLGIDALIPLGLIINEIFSNSLKHAFSDAESGTVKLKLWQIEAVTHLLISDNGKGSDITLEVLKNQSLGVDLIWSLTEQLDGEVSLKTNAGFVYEFKFSNLK